MIGRGRERGREREREAAIAGWTDAGQHTPLSLSQYPPAPSRRGRGGDARDTSCSTLARSHRPHLAHHRDLWVMPVALVAQDEGRALAALGQPAGLKEAIHHTLGPGFNENTHACYCFRTLGLRRTLIDSNEDSQYTSVLFVTFSKIQ